MNKTMLFSFLRVFLAASIAQYFQIGKDIFSLDTETWRAILGSGVSALIITAYNYVNPNDTRFGYKKKDLSEAGK